MSSELRQEYRTILAEYLLNPTENSLYQASNLSTDLVRKGFGPDEIIEIHLQSIEEYLKQVSPLKYTGLLLQSINFLLEIMIAYGLAHQEHLEKKNLEVKEISQNLEIIKRENLKLGQRATELEIIAEVSRILMEEHVEITETMIRVSKLVSSLFPNYAIGFIIPESQTILNLLNDRVNIINYESEIVKANLEYKNLTIFKKIEGNNFLYKSMLHRKCTSAIWLPIVDNDEVIWVMFFESHELIPFSDNTVRFLRVLLDLLITFYKRTSLVSQLAKQATIDELTGLFNYRYLDYILNLEIKRALRFSHPLSITIIDFDNFKILNDTYGHLVGDMGLKNVANTMRSNLRASDILCRYGGDEFVVISPETTLEQAYGSAERLRVIIEKDNQLIINEKRLNITVSIGLATMMHEYDNAHRLLKRADQALYQVKQTGRNRVSSYTLS